MDDERILSILAAADAQLELPRLGGMARPQGVFIGTEDFWAFASVTGGVARGNGFRGLPDFRRVPILRGLLRLVAALAPIFTARRDGGSRERFVFAAALVLPLAFVFLPQLVATTLGVLTTVAFLTWLFRGRTLQLHGAEHRAIAAAEERSLVATWRGTARPSRYALRCGTNFAVLALPSAYGLQQLWPFAVHGYTPIVLTILSLGAAMELWGVIHSGPRRLAHALLMPGLVIQRLTTREPTLEETRVALRAVATVLTESVAVAHDRLAHPEGAGGAHAMCLG